VAATLPSRVTSELDRLAGADNALAIGFSGGGDSLALLRIAVDWARRRDRSLLALIVDHGLRPDSADEARLAASRAQALGVEADILTWTSSAPTAGLQAAAREARHRLLAEACRQRQIRTLALAHTADDQAETVWMRVASGGGWRGAAGMREANASPLWPDGRGVTLIRPCLHETRAALRDWLTAAGACWIDDPSNDNPAFARIRIRKLLERLQRGGFQPARLTRWAAGLRALDEVEARAAGRLAETCLALHPWGGASLDPSVFPTASRTLRWRLLDAIICAVSGARDVPRPAVDRLLDAIEAGERATGGGALVDHWRDRVWLVRDPGAILGRVDRPGEGYPETAGLIDGRFMATRLPDTPPTPLGETYPELDRALFTDVPPTARPTLLAFRRDGHILALAGLVRHSGLECRSLIDERFVHRLFADWSPAWFDVSRLMRTQDQIAVRVTRKPDPECPYDG